MHARSFLLLSTSVLLAASVGFGSVDPNARGSSAASAPAASIRTYKCISADHSGDEATAPAEGEPWIELKVMSPHQIMAEMHGNPDPLHEHGAGKANGNRDDHLDVTAHGSAFKMVGWPHTTLNINPYMLTGMQDTGTLHEITRHGGMYRNTYNCKDENPRPKADSYGSYYTASPGSAGSPGGLQ